MHSLIAVSPETIEQFFNLPIYSLSVKKMRDDGKYDKHSTKISDEYFPMYTFPRDNYYTTFNLVRFTEPLYKEQAICSLTELKMRPANLIELLSFGIHYPDKQLKFRIVALGENHYYDKYPFLGGYSDVRYIFLDSIKHAWSGSELAFGPSWHFAAVEDNQLIRFP